MKKTLHFSNARMQIFVIIVVIVTLSVFVIQTMAVSIGMTTGGSPALQNTNPPPRRAAQDECFLVAETRAMTSILTRLGPIVFVIIETILVPVFLASFGKFAAEYSAIDVKIGPPKTSDFADRGSSPPQDISFVLGQNFWLP